MNNLMFENRSGMFASKLNQIKSDSSYSLIGDNQRKLVVLELTSKEDVRGLISYQNDPNKFIVSSAQAILQLSLNQPAREVISEFHNISQLQIKIPGYGLFKQNAYFDEIVRLVATIIDRNIDKNISKIKNLTLHLPGWTGLSQQPIIKLCDNICTLNFLEELKLNLNGWMNNEEKVDNNAMVQPQEKYYGKNTVTLENFKSIVKILKSCNNLKTLQLRMSNWRKINTEYFKIFMDGLAIQKDNSELKNLMIEISGWGYKSKEIKKQILEDFRTLLEDFNKLHEIHLDLRNWDEHYLLKAFKAKLKIIPSVFLNENSMMSKMIRSTSRIKRMSVFGKSQIKHNSHDVFKLTVLI